MEWKMKGQKLLIATAVVQVMLFSVCLAPVVVVAVDTDAAVINVEVVSSPQDLLLPFNDLLPPLLDPEVGITEATAAVTTRTRDDIAEDTMKPTATTTDANPTPPPPPQTHSPPVLFITTKKSHFQQQKEHLTELHLIDEEVVIPHDYRELEEHLRQLLESGDYEQAKKLQAKIEEQKQQHNQQQRQSQKQKSKLLLKSAKSPVADVASVKSKKLLATPTTGPDKVDVTDLPELLLDPLQLPLAKPSSDGNYQQVEDEQSQSLQTDATPIATSEPQPKPQQSDIEADRNANVINTQQQSFGQLQQQIIPTAKASNIISVPVKPQDQPPLASQSSQIPALAKPIRAEKIQHQKSQPQPFRDISHRGQPQLSTGAVTQGTKSHHVPSHLKLQELRQPHQTHQHQHQFLRQGQSFASSSDEHLLSPEELQKYRDYFQHTTHRPRKGPLPTLTPFPRHLRR